MTDLSGAFCEKLYIGNGVVKNLTEIIKSFSRLRKVLIISDSTVYSLYGDYICSLLKGSDTEVFNYVFKPGEASKSVESAVDIWKVLSDNHFTRFDCIVALGGGVTGDLSGFVASTFMRGIKFINIPTTLLSCVDSCIGGKNAVNLNGVKNVVGTFYRPDAVLCDCSFLKTLKKSELSNGFGEIIKYGMICSESILDALSDGYSDDFETIISECINIKCTIVAEDEYDYGSRRLLNFGHTVGHAVELLTHNPVSHGTAVAYGMKVVTASAVKSGICPSKVYNELLLLLDRYNLCYSEILSIDEIADSIASDKKCFGDSISVVLPVSRGKCVVRDMLLTDFIGFIRGSL